MTKSLTFCSILLFQLLIFAQEDAWVYFSNKENVSEALANPSSILTQKAINRKSKHGVTIDERDVPVNENYITQLKNANGITVLAKSKWLNAVHIRGAQIDIENLDNNPSFSFISTIDFADRTKTASKTRVEKTNSKFNSLVTDFNYGSALNQIQMINGNQLHLSNYTGTGITVAVLDAGFPNVNNLTAFQRLRNSGNILSTYDFVNRATDVYTNTTSNHGTLVLSTMAGFVEDQYVGTAPDAAYYLFVTEDGANENPVEESYWVEAAERADSLGVDIINSSLGYGRFYDNTKYNYESSDFDGQTTFVTRGANIAFEKGLMIINSAGNSGNAGVGAPADSAKVFSIGAVDQNGNYAFFSSVGNSFQPTQKPDVVAQGQASAVIRENGAIVSANGTSFSSPILAGGLVCLRQALPHISNAELLQLVRQSASQYNSPDNFLGYGIPDLESALNNGLSLYPMGKNGDEIKMYPNPVSTNLFFNLNTEIPSTIEIFEVSGKRILEFISTNTTAELKVNSFAAGMYFVKIQNSNQSKLFKLIKR